MIGALSSNDGLLFSKIVPTTNAIEVEAFFMEMAEKFDMTG